mmetsp:Transcript_4518/g.16509  ORF Transcript_4518/g.16509 Transcript_4518/m.16509 type:complete len:226 (-) Transcript_4518:1106-1783(-)
MTPPELTAHAPVVNVLEPVEPNLLVSLRYDLHLAVFHGIDTLLGHSVHLHKPLSGDQGLDNFSSSLRARNSLHVWLDLNRHSCLLHVLPQLLTRLKPVQPLIFTSILVKRSVKVHDVDSRKRVLLANLVIVRIMSRSNLEASSSKLHVDVCIRDDRDLSVLERNFNLLSDELLVSLVLWVDTNCSISQDGLRSSSSNRKKSVLVCKLIFEKKELSFLLAVLNLKI